MSKKKTALVTGCLGHIGCHVVEKLLYNGWKILGVDKKTYAANLDKLKDFEKHEDFSFKEEDIKDMKFLPDCDYVINIAAESHVGNSIVDSSSFLSSNVDGVRNLLELLRNKPSNTCDRPVLLHFSTDEVYGDIEVGSHIESDILKPSNPYSASKAAADMLITAWSRTYNLDYIIVRPTNNYGKYQYPEKLIPISVKMLMRGKKIRLHDAGKPVRTWLHADDTANAILTILNKGKTNEIYNISGDCQHENIYIAQKIVDSYNSLSSVENKPIKDYNNFLDLSYKRKGQDVRYSLDDSKLRRLGWRPKRKIEEEIKEVVKYYMNNWKW